MKFEIFFFVCMIGMIYANIDTVEKVESKKEKTARARQICHQDQWKFLSVKFLANGDCVYLVKDPGFGYKKITVKSDKSIDDVWLAS